jgi:hypothetical protein
VLLLLPLLPLPSLQPQRPLLLLLVGTLPSQYLHHRVLHLLVVAAGSEPPKAMTPEERG